MSFLLLEIILPSVLSCLMSSQLVLPNKTSALVVFLILLDNFFWNSIESLVNHWLQPDGDAFVSHKISPGFGSGIFHIVSLEEFVFVQVQLFHTESRLLNRPDFF